MSDELRTLASEVGGALAGLSCGQTQARPRDRGDTWSIQQIVEHLSMTYRSSVPAIEARVAKRAATRAKVTLKQWLGQAMVVGLQRFPEGRKAPAAVTPTLPASVQSGAELAARVGEELKALEAVIGEGEALFGKRRAVTHAVLGPMSMEQWRRFHLVHGRHHLKQIAAIRREQGF